MRKQPREAAIQLFSWKAIPMTPTNRPSQKNPLMNSVYINLQACRGLSLLFVYVLCRSVNGFRMSIAGPAQKKSMKINVGFLGYDRHNLIELF